jgi:hypothetical protein
MVRLSVTWLKPRRLEFEREQRERADRERQLSIFRAKVDVLQRNMKAWQENRELRAFIKAVETAASERPGAIEQRKPINEWLEWARSLADWNDPMGKFLDSLEKGSQS